MALNPRAPGASILGFWRDSISQIRLAKDTFLWQISQAHGSESVKADSLTLIKQIKEF